MIFPWRAETNTVTSILIYILMVAFSPKLCTAQCWTVPDTLNYPSVTLTTWLMDLGVKKWAVPCTNALHSGYLKEVVGEQTWAKIIRHSSSSCYFLPVSILFPFVPAHLWSRFNKSPGRLAKFPLKSRQIHAFAHVECNHAIAKFHLAFCLSAQ